MSLSRRLVCLLVPCLLAACASSPRATFYVLPFPSHAGDTVRTGGASPCAAAVERVKIPELLDRPQLVIPSSSTRVDVLEEHRWAEPLQDGVRRFVSGILERNLGVPPPHPRLEVSVEIQTLEGAPGASATLVALWEVLGESGRLRSGRFTSTDQVKGGGYDSVVAAYAVVLERLGAVVAREISDLMQEKGPGVCSGG